MPMELHFKPRPPESDPPVGRVDPFGGVNFSPVSHRSASPQPRPASSAPGTPFSPPQAPHAGFGTPGEDPRRGGSGQSPLMYTPTQQQQLHPQHHRSVPVSSSAHRSQLAPQTHLQPRDDRDAHKAVNTAVTPQKTPLFARGTPGGNGFPRGPYDSPGSEVSTPGGGLRGAAADPHNARIVDSFRSGGDRRVSGSFLSPRSPYYGETGRGGSVWSESPPELIVERAMSSSPSPRNFSSRPLLGLD